MKNIKILLISSLILNSTTMAMTSKVEEPELVKGTSIGHYAKPGAPIDITYTTEHVEVGEVSKVHIVLSTRIPSGTMHVKIKIKGLKEETNIEKELSMPLKDSKGAYPIDLKVSATTDGVYYVNFLASIKGKGFRAFAVPVYIGSGVLKSAKKVLEKTKSGENIIVSPAEETIIR